MGLFLSLSGIVGTNARDAVASLGNYALENNGELSEARLLPDDDNCLVAHECRQGATLLYPGSFLDWDNASEFLSRELGKPVFSWHIHDGDLWMYTLYVDGEVADQFNPLPDYWQELTETERQAWRGSAETIARLVPGVANESIARYLREWSDDILESKTRTKAYPDDEYFYGDDWQLVDFIKRLGFEYPLDGRGKPLGTTYLFRCDGE